MDLIILILVFYHHRTKDLVFNPGNDPVSNIRRSETSSDHQLSKLELLKSLDAETLNRVGKIDKLESAILNYETAYQMQSSIPDLMDLSRRISGYQRSLRL